MSATAGKVFEKEFDNKLEELFRVLEEAMGFLEEQDASVHTLCLARLAIEEMATNILKYAYEDSGRHTIVLRVQMEGGKVRIVLEDDGRPFNPLEAAPPDLNVPHQEREPGGLGIHLVRRMAGQMAYQRCQGRNRLTISLVEGASKGPFVKS